LDSRSFAAPPFAGFLALLSPPLTPPPSPSTSCLSDALYHVYSNAGFQIGNAFFLLISLSFFVLPSTTRSKGVHLTEFVPLSSVGSLSALPNCRRESFHSHFLQCLCVSSNSFRMTFLSPPRLTHLPCDGALVGQELVFISGKNCHPGPSPVFSTIATKGKSPHGSLLENCNPGRLQTGAFRRYTPDYVNPTTPFPPYGGRFSSFFCSALRLGHFTITR